MLDRLLDRYGKIKPSDLTKNATAFHETVDMSQPLDAYFKKMDKCIQYTTDGKTPFSAKQVLSTATYALQQTGVFCETLRVWKSKAAADKTWTNFKKDFLD
eukprot:2680799-Ditylum_brightwellii.AAC.1